MEPALIFLIPVTSDPINLKIKIKNCREFFDGCSLFNYQIWVVCNNSCSETVSIASNFADNFFVYGKIGKFNAIKNVINELPLDSFTILTDVNTVIHSIDKEYLVSLIKPDTAVIYSTVIRKDPSKYSDIVKPHFSYRLHIDNFFNLSSGAYGALYIVNSNLLINNYHKLIPSQNDDFFISCLLSEYGDVHYCDSLVVLEEESLSFKDEFARKKRDAQGHLHALVNLFYIFMKYKTISCLYGIFIRASIWLIMLIFPLILVYVMFVFPWSSLIFLPVLYHKRVAFYRLVGFYFGFFRGFFGQKLFW